MMIREMDGRRYASHTGGMIGYHAAAACDLDSGVGAVILANGAGPWEELAYHALKTVQATRADSAVPEFIAPPIDTALPHRAERTPDEWTPVVGHYRCYNPWLANIRVSWHDGSLWVWAGEHQTCLGEPLIQLPDGSYRVGADERSPERLRFDTVIDGKATRATLSGCALYRTFTP